MKLVLGVLSVSGQERVRRRLSRGVAGSMVMGDDTS
jgi:hypothetical protein